MSATSDRVVQMAKIRKKDTRPELAVRRVAHALGARFRLHRPDLPGTPDIVFPKRRCVIQVHGCFWHQHKGCKLARTPRRNLEYWLPKLARNIRRDAVNAERLRLLGWRLLIVWECETRDIEALRAQVADFLGPSQQS